MRRVHSLLTLLAVMMPAAVAAADPDHKLDQLAPISLHAGANTISRLAPDGRDGLVAYGWRDNGDAHGHHVMLVMLRDAGGQNWTVVSTERPGSDAAASDTIVDDPHTGEDVVRATRLVRGRVDGKAATLLFVATRMVAPGLAWARAGVGAATRPALAAMPPSSGTDRPSMLP